MNAYKKAIIEEMSKLGRLKNSIFLGQQVGVTDFYGTLANVPISKRIELPVAEEMQLGMSIGMALEGYLPVSIFQRMDFLPRACDQIVNHLDKIERLSHGVYNPKVIIRTTVGSRRALDCGLQHCQDLTEGFRKMVKFPVIKVITPREVKKAYKIARQIDTSIMIVEMAELY